MGERLPTLAKSTSDASFKCQLFKNYLEYCSEVINSIRTYPYIRYIYNPMCTKLVPAGYGSTNLDICAKVRQVCQCSQCSALGAHSFATSRCLDTTEIRHSGGVPNVGIISHKFAGNVIIKIHRNLLCFGHFNRFFLRNS